ncbi:MAG: S-layer homology domain-containing protein [Symbiobacteriia bacterium]
MAIFMVLALAAATVFLWSTGNVLVSAYGTTAPPVVAGAVSGAVTAASGGTVTLDNGVVAVNFPAGAVDADVTVTISPVTTVTQNMAGYIKVGSAIFELVAENVAGDAITSFKKPVTLSFSYKDADLAGTAETGLTIFYWDPVYKAWIAVPTTLDPTTNVATASVDHFTVFALLGSDSFKKFNDMAGHWAEGDVLKLASLGVAKGFADGGYHPGDTITRAQFTNLLVIAAGLAPVAHPTLSFKDADQIPVWSQGYVAAGVTAGLIAGYEDNTFRPNALVTRAEMAKLVAGALKLKNKLPANPASSFTDNDSVPSWAKDSVGQAASAGIIKGMPDGSFAPSRTATRAEAATMITRLMDRITK